LKKQKGIKLYTTINDIPHFSGVIYDIFVREFYKADFANKVVIDVGAVSWRICNIFCNEWNEESYIIRSR